MSTTALQDAKFKDALIPNSLLDEAIDWIKSNLSPEEVFDETDLYDWAKSKSPDDVFSESELDVWADKNGFIKE